MRQSGQRRPAALNAKCSINSLQVLAVLCIDFLENVMNDGSNSDRSKNLSRRSLYKLLVAGAALSIGILGCGGSETAATVEPKYYAAWTGALLDVTTARPSAVPGTAKIFDNQTVRHVLRSSIGGDSVKIKLSNLFGKTAITFSGVRVAKSAGKSAIDVSTDKEVLFGGKGSVTLAPGQEMLSDPIALQVSPLTDLAVSMFFATPTTVATVHALGVQNAFVSAGNVLSAASIVQPIADGTWQSYWGLTAVEVSSTEKTNVVVTFGDSITDGFRSTVDGYKRYPNLLDIRLKAAGQSRTSVVNAGISGNRWLNLGSGPSGNSRFERDVLNVTGVTHTIILLGINDIGNSIPTREPTQAVTVEELTFSLETAISKAKAKGIKVLVATILPYKGAAYYSDSGEVMRVAVNAWIRNNKVIDGVVDFDKIMQSSSDPAVMNPLYDAGDFLHPNDAGYAAMAAAIDLAKLQ